jgi:hypothetical protein
VNEKLETPYIYWSKGHFVFVGISASGDKSVSRKALSYEVNQPRAFLGVTLASACPIAVIKASIGSLLWGERLSITTISSGLKVGKSTSLTKARKLSVSVVLSKAM